MTATEFHAVVESVNAGRGAAVRLPFNAKDAFGRARAPVLVTIGEHESFRTTVAVYGGVGWIGLRKGQLADMALSVGDAVTMRVALDTEAREVEVPDELEIALTSDPETRAFYDGLSFTHRKEYARWVAGAKRSETRRRRAAKAVEMLRRAIRTPG